MLADAALAVNNLLGRYAELMDAGKFEEVADLFRHARVKLGGDTYVDADGVLATWVNGVRRYADGTPKTKHVITNVIVEADGDEVVARSYYTVLQQVDDFPLQPIITGRYVDRFEQVDGTWRWKERDYSLIDQIGDLSRHLNFEVRR